MFDGGRFYAGQVRFADISDSPDQRLLTSPSLLPEQLDIKFGFLPAGGIYETDLCAIIDDPAIILSDPKLTVVNKHLQEGGNSILVLQLTADRPGPFESEFNIIHKDRKVSVHVTATVIPRHKGTPGLRQHIRFIAAAAAETDIE